MIFEALNDSKADWPTTHPLPTTAFLKVEKCWKRVFFRTVKVRLHDSNFVCANFCLCKFIVTCEIHASQVSSERFEEKF
jgi:hypothetical protein